MTKTIPFTYKIKCLPTNQWYYGVRWASGCSPKDLWVTYFTSSRHIKNLIKEYGKDAFIVSVSRTFSTKEEARAHETRFLKRVKASSNGAFINKTNGSEGFHFSAKSKIIIHNISIQRETWHDPHLPIPEGWGRGISDSHRISNSNAQKGKTAHNKGKPGHKTGPCKESRREAIRHARINTKKIMCEYCDKESDPGNFKKYHGDSCKKNPNHDKTKWETYSNTSRKATKKSIETGSFNHFGRKKKFQNQESSDILLQTLDQFFQEVV